MARSIARQIVALERHKTFLNMADGDLGRDLCKIATDGCLECIIGEQTPDGTRWDKLSGRYGKWKGKKYPGRPMAVLHFLMARPEEVAGEIEVTAHSAKVTYGKSAEAREEASWFQNGRPPYQPPRPFWGFTERSRARAVERVGRSFREKVRS